MSVRNTDCFSQLARLNIPAITKYKRYSMYQDKDWQLCRVCLCCIDTVTKYYARYSRPFGVKDNILSMSHLCKLQLTGWGLDFCKAHFFCNQTAGVSLLEHGNAFVYSVSIGTMRDGPSTGFEYTG